MSPQRPEFRPDLEGLRDVAILLVALYAPIDRASIASNARADAMYSGNMAFAKESVDYFSAGENPLLRTWSLAGALMVAERKTREPAQQAFAAARESRVDHG